MKKYNWFICIIAAAIAVFSLQSCGKGKSGDSGSNAIYYWRTTFKLNNYEREFLQKHDIDKMYVRFFDVDNDWDRGVVPVATTIFLDSVPKNVEIVPTVFITSQAITEYPEFIDKLLTRVVDMADANGIEFKEIQIDCDWKESAAKKYFAFMSLFRKKLSAKDIALSTTVRLYQLGYDTPDADYGVLMCYNTGDVSKWETDNSILDMKDVAPYLEKLKKFKMPLSVAFPDFAWDVSFSKYGEDQYYDEGIKYTIGDFSDDERFQKIGENRYKDLESESEYSTKYLRHEEVSADDVLKVKKAVLENLHSSPKQIVLYHLDSANLSKYSDNDVEEIYR